MHDHSRSDNVPINAARRESEESVGFLSTVATHTLWYVFLYVGSPSPSKGEGSVAPALAYLALHLYLHLSLAHLALPLSVLPRQCWCRTVRGSRSCQTGDLRFASLYHDHGVGNGACPETPPRPYRAKDWKRS